MGSYYANVLWQVLNSRCNFIVPDLSWGRIPPNQSVTVISCLWSWGFELMTYSSLVQHSLFWISNTEVLIGFGFILCVHVPSAFRRYVFIRLWEETDSRRSSIILISQWEIVQIMAAGLPSYRSSKKKIMESENGESLILLCLTGSWCRVFCPTLLEITCGVVYIDAFQWQSFVLVIVVEMMNGHKHRCSSSGRDQSVFVFSRMSHFPFVSVS